MSSMTKLWVWLYSEENDGKHELISNISTFTAEKCLEILTKILFTNFYSHMCN